VAGCHIRALVFGVGYNGAADLAGIGASSDKPLKETTPQGVKLESPFTQLAEPRLFCVTQAVTKAFTSFS
jgi:hypothetical protein